MINNGVGSNPTASDRGLRVYGVMVAFKKKVILTLFY